jgi:hypothetical protein
MSLSRLSDGYCAGTPAVDYRQVCAVNRESGLMHGSSIGVGLTRVNFGYQGKNSNRNLNIEESQIST